MNKYSLFTAATATTVAISSLAVPVSAESSHPFTDVGSQYDDAVSFLYDIEVINGISATKFGTSQTLTRGDAAVILANMRLFDTKDAPDAGFRDLNARVRGSVNALAEIGVISGVTKTEFKPEQTLSRGAMAKFLVTAYELEKYAKQTSFTDAGGVFKPYIEALHGTGITSGKTNISYGTNLNITRGEFANLLYKTFFFVLEKENFYIPWVANAQVISTTQTKINLTEAVPKEYIAGDVMVWLQFNVQYSNGSVVEFDPASYFLTADRKALVINHTNLSLAGKKGTMIIKDFKVKTKASFDFAAVKISSSTNVDSSFTHTDALPATQATK
ncbi:S-layer homology domain-containing protein [Bacillus cihuensis]|uniref:S-layer homology domain-containing protein n=1 Tax=Bacillus cihuensis TaxID=1208599 RepID=UPI0004069D2F|nr:S-layer homology domain-containing protein [Bacillus cihuensis]